jgi:sugar phosphate isomerase/epimerase
LEYRHFLQLGIKTDPIETRYSFDWLFSLAKSEGIQYIQLGSFFELYVLEDAFFCQLKENAEKYGLRIKSMFTAHRELGGFFYGDVNFEKAARNSYERFIEIAAILGVDYCGSNPGAVYRDRMSIKDKAIDRYLSHMRELMHLAAQKGLKGLTMEPMSSLAEPPSTPSEMDRMIGELTSYHRDHPVNTVPVYLCGDISHGIADKNYKITYSNIELFKHGLQYMSEFHFKNTDPIYNNTFGFTEEEMEAGIIDLKNIREIIDKSRSVIPVDEFVGYLEIGGPKVGRDYSDPLLEDSLRGSLRTLKSIFK